MPTYLPPAVLWAYDKLQFARLLAEAEAAGLFDANEGATVAEGFAAMAASTGLGPDDLSDLIDRAAKFWDAFKGPELRVLAAPLTPAEAAEIADDDGGIEGVVAAELSLFVDNDLEGVLDALGERLVEGGSILSGTAYEVVGQQGDTLYVRVAGDASVILDEFDLAERSEDEDDEDDDE